MSHPADPPPGPSGPSGPSGAPGTAAPADRVAAGLAVGRGIGLFFAIAQAPTADDDPGDWRDPGRLTSSQALESALHDIGVAIEAPQDHALAASLFVQGLASRLLSPQVACLAASGCVPDLPRALVWRRPGTAFAELGLRPTTGRAGADDRLLEHLWDQSRAVLLDPVTDAVRRRVGLPRSIVAGNLASSLLGALQLLPDHLGDRRSRLLAAAHRLAPVAQAMRTTAQGGARRRTCCLYYRAPRPVLCGSCPLLARAERDRSTDNNSAGAG